MGVCTPGTAGAGGHRSKGVSAAHPPGRGPHNGELLHFLLRLQHGAGPAISPHSLLEPWVARSGHRVFDLQLSVFSHDNSLHALGRSRSRLCTEAGSPEPGWHVGASIARNTRAFLSTFGVGIYGISFHRRRHAP
jgi:hypothetical protein